MSKTMRRVIAVLIVAVTIGTAGWLMVRRSNAARNPIKVSNTGSLSIRLWGIRPNAGNTIYDPNGKVIARTLGIAGWDSRSWYDTSRRYDFIFELPEPNGPVLLTPKQEVFVSGEENPVARPYVSHGIFTYQGRTLLWLGGCEIPHKFKKNVFFGLWKRKIPFDTVDLKFRYYYGPPRDPLCSFKGPFAVGQKLTDPTGRYEISFETHPHQRYGMTAIRISTTEQAQSDLPVIAYDARDTRWIIRRDSQVSHKVPNAYATQELYRIASLTIGEKQHEQIFTKIKLDVPGGNASTCAPYLKRMAEKLDLKISERDLVKYAFKDANEAFDVIDIVRGSHIQRATGAICADRWKGSGLDLSDFTEEQLSKLRRAALEWTRAMDPDIRAAGVYMGLYCGWPEFVEPALALLGNEFVIPQKNRHTAGYALKSYSLNLSDAEIYRIRDILVCESDPTVLISLRACLHQPKSPARVEVLSQLAEDERPWIWTFAIEALANSKEYLKERDLLPEKLKLRVLIARGSIGISNPEQYAAQTRQLRRKILTPELYALNTSAFYKVLGNIAKHPDRRYATACIIDFLRVVRAYTLDETRILSRMLKYINLWHDLDIGGLGKDFNKEVRGPGAYNWPGLVAEAVAWYDSEYGSSDADVAE